jgi:hypothetical protein
MRGAIPPLPIRFLGVVLSYVQRQLNIYLYQLPISPIFLSRFSLYVRFSITFSLDMHVFSKSYEKILSEPVN